MLFRVSLDFLKSNSSESSRLVSDRYEEVRIQNDINIFCWSKSNDGVHGQQILSDNSKLL